MRRSTRTARSAWLYALWMAWATSALLLLDQSRLLYALACLAWLALAWRCLAGTRLAFARRAVSYLLALALPVQGFAMAAVDTRGPAHVHPAGAGLHSHGEVRHHHHRPGAAILVDDGTRARQQSLGTAEDKRLAFGGADSIAPSSLLISASDPSRVAPNDRIAHRATHVVAALERPPRLLSASLPS